MTIAPPTDDHFQQIYSGSETTAIYDDLVRYEDHQGNLSRLLADYLPEGGHLLDVGAGTGRVSQLLEARAGQIASLDINLPMIKQARRYQHTREDSWWLLGGEISRLPFPNGWADLTIEGWALGHWMAWLKADWQPYITRALDEMSRTSKGAVILIETLGTGATTPMPPNHGLATLYEYWETKQGFRRYEVRTDYQFPDVATAVRLVGFFFGPQLAQQLADSQSTHLPEWTGVWVR